MELARRHRREAAVEESIDEGLKNTSVTAVLIGAQTSERKYVQYEITQSYNKTEKNVLLGIYIHNLRDREGRTDAKGKNPFDDIYIEQDGCTVYFSELYKTYDWIYDNGYNNIGSWVETAAKEAGR